MKTVKLFIFVIVSLFITGCYSPNSNEPATIEFANTKKLDSIRLNDSTEITTYFKELNSHYIDTNDHIIKNKYRRMLIYKFNYDGHKYIMFSVNKFENGVVHDPECECFNEH